MKTTALLIACVAGGISGFVQLLFCECCIVLTAGPREDWVFRGFAAHENPSLLRHQENISHPASHPASCTGYVH